MSLRSEPSDASQKQEDHWKTRATRLVSDGTYGLEAATAVFNVCALALRQGRYVEFVARRDALEARRRAAYEQLTSPRTAHSLRLERAIDALDGMVDEARAAWAEAWDDAQPDGVLRPPESVTRFLRLHSAAMNPPTPRPGAVAAVHSVGFDTAGVREVTYADPSDKSRPVDLDRLLEELRAVSYALTEERRRTVAEMERTAFVGRLTAAAVRLAEVYATPPLYDDVDWARTVGPLYPPAPMSADNVEFTDGRAYHLPFKDWIIDFYLYAVGALGMDESTAKTFAVEEHLRHHGPIISARFPGRSVKADRRNVEKYVEEADLTGRHVPHPFSPHQFSGPVR